MAGQMVEFPVNGKTGGGYLATPASGNGSGVVVIQEWWGLVPHIKTIADRFAAEGFVALAPDLYHGETTTSPDAAGKLMMALDNDTRPEVYHAGYANETWTRTVDFFHTHLG